jgi:hypothetical protein
MEIIVRRKTEDSISDCIVHPHTTIRNLGKIAYYIVASQTSVVCCELRLAANSYSSMQRSLVASGCSIT